MVLCWVYLCPGGQSKARTEQVYPSYPAPSVPSIRELSIVLENEFEKETGIRVRHVGAGTGAALDIAKKGNVDLVLVHAKSLEEKFVAGRVWNRKNRSDVQRFRDRRALQRPCRDQRDEDGHGGPEEDFRKARPLYQSRGQIRHPCGRDGVVGKSGDQAIGFLVCDL